MGLRSNDLQSQTGTQSEIIVKSDILEGDGQVRKSNGNSWTSRNNYIESLEAVVASDDGRCSEIGALILAKGGNAVDAAIATALCLGVVSPMSSRIGGGGFMVVLDSNSKETIAVNMRETAPSGASRDMYENDPLSKSAGPMSVGVPGELFGLYLAWSKFGRLPWRELFQPAIQFAKEGFEISPFTAYYLEKSRDIIENDPGLIEIFMRDDELLKDGDLCINLALAKTLDALAEIGHGALYGGPIGEKLVEDVRSAGGILAMDDLRNYKAQVTNAVSTKAFGYEILGVPPPSSGALGLGLVLNILEGYGSKEALREPLGSHRLAEALKHMYAARMNLGDPNFEDVDEMVSKMLCPSFAASIRKKIDDQRTFSAAHYGARSSQFVDDGTSHIIVVDKDRNVVSMTTSLNDRFGGGMLSMCTGIILNNVMADFSTPTDETHDNLPPAETNFIKPEKRPLSSMTPIIVLKDNQFAGAIGGGGGSNIIPAVTQIFINHFVLGMEPLAAVESPRIYHSLNSEVASCENWTVFDGKHFDFSEEKKGSLMGIGHKLDDKGGGGAICQFVVQNSFFDGLSSHGGRGVLTAVCDPRKGGWPGAL